VAAKREVFVGAQEGRWESAGLVTQLEARPSSQYRGQSNLSFESGQDSTQTEVNAVTERQASFDRAIEVQVIGVSEAAWIPISGSVEQQYFRPSRNSAAMSMDGCRRGSSKPLDRCIEAQVLIEGFQANLPVDTFQVTWGNQSACQSVQNTGNETSRGFSPGSNEG